MEPGRTALRRLFQTFQNSSGDYIPPVTNLHIVGIKMQHFDGHSLNSISYSLIQTEQVPDDYSDDDCTCGHEDHNAFGDGLMLRQVYPPRKMQQLAESVNNYGTATEHEMSTPYPKHVADRFEAEYDYTMRWASDAKFVAAKVIPFQSNFSSVVRLMFKGRNWVLDCANFDGQYDYCGWLPSAPNSSPQKYNVRNKKHVSLMTDSSLFSTNQRQAAGRSLNPSDTGYGLQSLKTDYSSNHSGLTKDPIDSNVYNILGDSGAEMSESQMQNSLHATLENLSPIPGNTNMAVRSASDISTGSSLKAVFHDLVELDKMYAQQLAEAESQRSVLDNYVNCLSTAHSFSDSALAMEYVSTVSVSDVKEDSEDVAALAKTQPSMFGPLACLAGRKINIAFWKNWTKKKK